MAEKEQAIIRKDDEIFRCVKCGSKDLRWPWSGLTNENRIYILLVCADCEEVTPFEVDKIIAALCGVQIVLAPGSRAVN